METGRSFPPQRHGGKSLLPWESQSAASTTPYSEHRRPTHLQSLPRSILTSFLPCWCLCSLTDRDTHNTHLLLTSGYRVFFFVFFLREYVFMEEGEEGGRGVNVFTLPWLHVGDCFIVNLWDCSMHMWAYLCAHKSMLVRVGHGGSRV